MSNVGFSREIAFFGAATFIHIYSLDALLLYLLLCTITAIIYIIYIHIYICVYSALNFLPVFGQQIPPRGSIIHIAAALCVQAT